MTTATFDTLKFVRTLEGAGLDAKAAEDIAVAQRDAYKEMTGDFATKTELQELKAKMHEVATKGDLDIGIQQLRIEMRDMKNDMVKWMVGIAVTQYAILIGILMKLINS
jgi:predicted oxidoreductase